MIYEYNIAVQLFNAVISFLLQVSVILKIVYCVINIAFKCYFFFGSLKQVTEYLSSITHEALSSLAFVATEPR